MNGQSDLTPLVAATQNLARAYVNGAGKLTSAPITSSTLVFAGAGTLVSITSLVAGTTTGYVYDSATTGGASSSNYISPAGNMLGVLPCGHNFNNGLVVIPGTGQTLAVTYSQALPR